MSPPLQESRLKRLGRLLGRPVLGPIDGRVGDINRRVGTVADSIDAYAAAVEAYAQATIETASYAGVELRRIQDGIEQLLAGNGALPAAPADSGVVELPFALAVLGRLEPPARILAIGEAGSAFALSAASLGYRVLAAGDGSLPYEHPNIDQFSLNGNSRAHMASAEDRVAASFVSGVSADAALLEQIAGLLDEDGFLVLSASQDAEPPLAGWQIRERRLVARTKPLTWLPVERFGEGETGVVMIVATPVRPE